MATMQSLMCVADNVTRATTENARITVRQLVSISVSLVFLSCRRVIHRFDLIPGLTIFAARDETGG
jgi:hypothetical protein